MTSTCVDVAPLHVRSTFLTPFTLYARVDRLIGEGGGGGGGGDPPMTSATVLTTVPFAARGWSQSSRAVKLAWVIEFVLQPLQMLWKTRMTQPPPLFSAWVT